MDIDKLKYPIGQFEPPKKITQNHVNSWIDEISELPELLTNEVEGLNPEQLDTPYRPEGWTIRQVIHHIADSHTNSLIRFKWALTEDRPVIKAYYEERWAELADYKLIPIVTVLSFIDVLHQRWVCLLKSLTPKDLSREFIHPDSGPVNLAQNIGIYAWHGKHHVAHICSLKTKMNWS